MKTESVLSDRAVLSEDLPPALSAIQNALWACVVALERPESTLPKGHKLAVAKDARLCIVALDARPRFFMDHGVWHDRVSGQHLYTDDQHTAVLDEAWKALQEAGIERDGWISIPEAIKNLATKQPHSAYPVVAVGSALPDGHTLCDWTPADQEPAAPGWYERWYTDGVHAHYWTGSLWSSTKDGKAHWRQKADSPYPLWRAIAARDARVEPVVGPITQSEVK